jgi:hypothetical protein
MSFFILGGLWVTGWLQERLYAFQPCGMLRNRLGSSRLNTQVGQTAEPHPVRRLVTAQTAFAAQRSTIKPTG